MPLFHIEIEDGARLYEYHRNAANQGRAEIFARIAHNKERGFVPNRFVRIVALIQETRGHCPRKLESRGSP